MLHLPGLTFWLGNAFVRGIGMAGPWARIRMDKADGRING